MCAKEFSVEEGERIRTMIVRRSRRTVVEGETKNDQKKGGGMVRGG